MTILFDADSLLWSSCYKEKENPDDSPFNDNLEEVVFKFDEVFMSIVNKLEETYEIDKVVTFCGSKGNFRKMLTPTYKANRKKANIPPLLNELTKYVQESYDAVYKAGYETDDLVASMWAKNKEESIIVSIDKDYLQFPAIIYNYHYNHQSIKVQTKQEALYFFYEQMIVGDTADNVNFCKGYGKAYCKKAFKECTTAYQFRRKVFELFKKIYKSKAREKFILCYNLLKLRTNAL